MRSLSRILTSALDPVRPENNSLLLARNLGLECVVDLGRVGLSGDLLDFIDLDKLLLARLGVGSEVLVLPVTVPAVRTCHH